MDWRVEILSQEVVAEIEALPVDMRAKLEHIVRLIQTPRSEIELALKRAEQIV